MMNRRREVSFGVSLLLMLGAVGFADEGLPFGVYPARDSLQPMADDSADARSCLDNLLWNPAEFEVTVQRPAFDEPHAIIRFPSPAPSGVAQNDLVALEWYAPKTDDGQIAKAPAVVVVHESGRKMEVGRMFAKAIYAKGFHAFLIHLPYYGLRRPANFDQNDGSKVVPLFKQGISDVRRARDAVAAIPYVRSDHIALQGTSLGGFVAATTAGLDRGFDQVFIMVAGGHLYEVLMNGARDAVEMRKKFEAAGYSDEKLRSLMAMVEPTRLAHRLNPKTTWMYTGKSDQVVPWKCALALQQAANLPEDHHVVLWGDHYRAVLFMPVIVEHMAERIREYDGESK